MPQITISVSVSEETIKAVAKGGVRRWCGPDIAEDVVRAVLEDAAHLAITPDLPNAVPEDAPDLPSVRRIMRTCKVGYPKALEIRAALYEETQQ